MAEIRVSSAERDDAIAALGVHLSSGRLSSEEYERRQRQAAEALTRAELETLFDDLPAPHPDLTAAITPRRPTIVNPEWPGGRTGTRVSRVMDAIGVLSLLVGLPVAIVMTAVSGAWWTFLVVFGVAGVAMVLGVAFMTPATAPAPADDDHEENGAERDG